MPQLTELADAAITMLTCARRTADPAAGLPARSASYDFRTSQALLEATVERLAKLDNAAIRQYRGKTWTPSPSGR